MTAKILVVDDVPANVQLLEVKLTAEYYDVITAPDGFVAIEQAKTHMPDLILLDVMMPGMDGFETCQRLKSDPQTSHIPIVMVTALNQPSDRVQGLNSGADDFLTKPINETALFARVKSSIRIKVLIDELRLRDQTKSQMGEIVSNSATELDVSNSLVYVIDDDAVQGGQICQNFGEHYNMQLIIDPEEAITRLTQDYAAGQKADLIIVSTQLCDIDGLRICSQLRSNETFRHVPILMMIDDSDERSLVKGLELGVNDYIHIPPDYNEMHARIRTQLRRKKYQDALKDNYHKSVSLAITDKLTGLYNRNYLDIHLTNMFNKAVQNKRPFSVLLMDMDHFKHVNDTYGHQSGDEVLQQLSKIIVDSVRSSDLVARYGGEEFVVVMPDSDVQDASNVAERIRENVESHDFKVSHSIGVINKTISIGASHLRDSGDSPEFMLKRADAALYHAKNNGRNRAVSAA